MNKMQLIKSLQEELKLSKPHAGKCVEVFFNEMSKALENGDRVEIRGLCSFFVKEYGSYTGRNPKTGQNLTVEPKKLPSFKMGKELRDRMNRQAG